MLPTDSHPPSLTLAKKVDDYADNAERVRRAHATLLAGTASNRAATAKSSKEEMKGRRAQRKAAAAQKPGAATAHLTFANRAPRQIALLDGDEAVEAMLSRPTRLPNLILQSPHEAAPLFHEDWTRVDGSNTDPEKWEKEQRLRYERNKMIHEYLVDSRAVFYISSGNSMWPLVQSNDGCSFHPIQAVRDMVGEHAVHKEASEIGVGDIVFCQVQPSQHYYAHFVLSIEQDYYANEEKYWIGNIQGKRNGWCYREHIYGILVDVQVRCKEYLYSRPHPKSIYEKVRDLGLERLSQVF